jgi:hypothetical protein
MNHGICEAPQLACNGLSFWLEVERVWEFAKSPNLLPFPLRPYSRVITGAARVSPAATDRVVRAIRALDFQRDESARALAGPEKGQTQSQLDTGSLFFNLLPNFRGNRTKKLFLREP